ncbi:hypothetical protein COCSADRAFT_344834 [Bipolaris sorokiniana ND90Pr]|uniref:O-methyltransferase C-terminal domain-containing protein n=1 Tax=Cochliobolus sativus (strain ND90Pr / ATCC 201652) TaxID=665912 RepID=M2S0L9_COCSN|nr:uncharacterized protein COCSADRAFT_344834 [Bipolaris sorokiniana ND90Pr]EMD60793.1 hypothetical protein COCSADRAFT_344834 [Bipolaris sorokiniana ND90Pr]
MHFLGFIPVHDMVTSQKKISQSDQACKAMSIRTYACTSVSFILERIVAAGKDYQREDIGLREDLIELGRDLLAALEIPSEFLRRSFWSEPALSAHCKLAVQLGLFQYLKDAGETGSSIDNLTQKTGVDTSLLQRIPHHLVSMKLLTFSNEKFLGTPLSDGLAAENFQKSIDFCYDVARPSFNCFPTFFKEMGYRIPNPGTNGPFQAAHGTELPFFPWLGATPPHLDEFDNFMSAYRAGKPNWYSVGFYPVAAYLIEGFDKDASETLLVDIGGGRGRDVQQFIAEHKAHPGKIVLQDREPIIASVSNQDKLPFELQTDEEGIKILENLRPALKSGYSQVLLVEIVVSEEEPTIAETAADMMMLAHLAVRERTRVEWEGVLEKAGYRLVGFYNFPGVAESVIEAELREAP